MIRLMLVSQSDRSWHHDWIEGGVGCDVGVTRYRVGIMIGLRVGWGVMLASQSDTGLNGVGIMMGLGVRGMM
jgi:hypothetical protein